MAKPAKPQQHPSPARTQPGEPPPVVAELPGETKRCPVCGERIWSAAKKCVHCDADFTWRRYLAFSSTTLALMTALISVIAASAPALYLMTTPDNSKLSGVFVGIGSSGATASMLFNNGGRRAGAINKIWITVLYKKADEERLFSIYPHTEADAAIFVDPGKTVPAQFSFANARTYWRSPNAEQDDLPRLASEPFWDWNARDKAAECKVSLSGVNADGSQFESTSDIPCQGGAFQMFRKLAADIASRQ